MFPDSKLHCICYPLEQRKGHERTLGVLEMGARDADCFFEIIKSGASLRQKQIALTLRLDSTQQV